MKEQILQALNNPSENFYNPLYLVGSYLKEREIDIDTVSELKLADLIDFANFTTEIFY